MNVDRGKWSNLAQGTAMLLKTRGPGRYQSAFERAMLEAQMPFVVGVSTFLRFLASSELTKLADSKAVRTSHPNQTA